MPYIEDDNGIPICRKPGVYVIRNHVNGKVYVGSSISVSGRLRGHVTHLSRGDHTNKKLQRAWTKHGIDSFEFGVLETCDPVDLIKCEQKWIDKFDASGRNTGYNICPKADSRLGVKHTEKACNKISKTKTLKYMSEPGPRTGAILSEETKRKISNSKKGSKMSLESRQKMSKARKGKKMSAQRRANYIANHWSKGPNAAAIAAKIGKGHAGKIVSEEQKAKISATKLRQAAEKRLLPSLN